MAVPTYTTIERIRIQRPLHEEPESGLDGLLLTLVSASLSGMGLHALGEGLHALQTSAEVTESLKPRPQGQTEVLARQAFDRELGQPTLNTGNPVVEMDAWVPVTRKVNVLDPGLRVTDPAIAAQYQRPTLATSLASAMFGHKAPERAPEPRRAPSRKWGR
jgi:hypothetical protein